VGAVATPLALVATVAVTPVPGDANVPLAPLEGAVKVTLTPEIGLLLASVTVTERAANAVFTATLCEPFALITSFEGGPARFVSEYAAFAETPVTEALTVYAPAVVFAVKAGALAMPLAFVFTTIVVPPFVPSRNVPLAPLEGAVNVTVALFTGLPPLSFTVACKVAKAAPMVTLCVAPPVAVIVAAGPVRLVSEKLVETVPALACTL
jgi:hypothetical protein